MSGGDGGRYPGMRVLMIEETNESLDSQLPTLCGRYQSTMEVGITR